jgi:hypothetical protein
MKKLTPLILLFLLGCGVEAAPSNKENYGLIRIPVFRDYEATDIQVYENRAYFINKETGKRGYVSGNFVVLYGETFHD